MKIDFPREMLTPTEAAALIGCSDRTLASLRATGRGPTWRRVSARRIGYVRADVERWLREGDTAPKAAGVDAA